MSTHLAGRTRPRANPRGEPKEPRNQVRNRWHLLFTLGDLTFGVPSERVRGVVDERPIDVSTADASADMPVIRLKSTDVPVLDLHSRYGMDPRPRNGHTSAVIVTAARRTVAFLVDAIGGMHEVRDPDIAPLSTRRTRDEPRSIVGVAKVAEGVAVLVDLDRVVPDLLNPAMV